MDFLTSPAFWFALGQIILIDILLGGDNAVVIALACRKLPPQLRTKGILWGTAGAILLRVVLIAFAMTLLTLSFIKVLGALLLLWIGVKLIAPDDDDHGNVQSSDKLLAAIQTIIVADLVMSVDNVIAIAGAAHSAPGEHHLLGWIAGSMAVTDPVFVSPEQWQWVPKLTPSDAVKHGASVAGALLVLLIGKWLQARRKAALPDAGLH